MQNLIIFDTTLRDGEQAPGFSMHLSEKLEIAQQLVRLKVDVAEVGFAASSKADYDAVKRIADEIKGITICSLARASFSDIDVAYNAIKSADSARLHVFIATSPIHMQYKLNMTENQVLEKVDSSVRYAKKLLSDVQFSAEDAMRSNINFLMRVVETAINAGATTINIPDTVGYSCPIELKNTFSTLNNKYGDKVVFAVHCHDDLGMAVANSLSAVLGGARQIECTLNGIGERAGNAALEEVVMAVKTRADFFNLNVNIETKELYKSSRLLSAITGIKMPPSKAIVGKNVFRHESGIHQHGVLKNKATYEIISPEQVGIVENDLVLGKHSGRHAFASHLTSLGYNFDNSVVEVLFNKFKTLAARKKAITDKDIESLITNTNKNSVERKYRLVSYSLSTVDGATAATVVLDSPEGRQIAEGVGDGPVDACFKAINGCIKKEISLDDFNLSSVTEGEDALGVAVLRVSFDSVTMTGRGVSTDIVEASILAYINGTNKLLEE